MLSKCPTLVSRKEDDKPDMYACMYVCMYVCITQTSFRSFVFLIKSSQLGSVHGCSSECTEQHHPIVLFLLQCHSWPLLLMPNHHCPLAFSIFNPILWMVSRMTFTIVSAFVSLSGWRPTKSSWNSRFSSTQRRQITNCSYCLLHQHTRWPLL